MSSVSSPERNSRKPRRGGRGIGRYGDPATGRHLARHLALVVQGAQAGLPGLQGETLELFIDVAQKGRSIRGYLDTAERLRSGAEPRYRVLGDLPADKPGRLRWRLFDSADGGRMPRYECHLVLDEVWGYLAMRGRPPSMAASSTLSGHWPCPSRTIASWPTSRPFPKPANAPPCRKR